MHHGTIEVSQILNLSDEEILEQLPARQMSTSGKEKASRQALLNIPGDLRRQIYAAMKQTANLGSIEQIHQEQIREDVDLLTCSFPRQDLSAAGYWHGCPAGFPGTEEPVQTCCGKSSEFWKSFGIPDAKCPAFC